MIQIDERFDFARLIEPLEDYYCRDNGRPAIHPEVLVRALLISSLYNITSFRRLCSAISEDIAFRWFCFLTIYDKVFDHSTISYLIERIGNEGFGEMFHRFNEELLRMGLLSRQMYADSSLVRANVGGHNLSHSGMSVDEFKNKAVEENGLFALSPNPPKRVSIAAGAWVRDVSKWRCGYDVSAWVVLKVRGRDFGRQWRPTVAIWGEFDESAGNSGHPRSGPERSYGQDRLWCVRWSVVDTAVRPAEEWLAVWSVRDRTVFPRASAAGDAK